MQQVLKMKFHCLMLSVLASLALSTILVGSAAFGATISEEFATPTAAAATATSADINSVPVAVVDDVGIVVVDDVGRDLAFDTNAQQTAFAFEPCNLNDPNLNECIKGLFDLFVPLLKDQALPDYGMISIDPYFYRRGIFRYANDGVQGGLLIKNMQINGISGLRANSIASNFTDTGAFIMKLGLEIPKIEAGGQFKADVKFGGLRLVPKGPFNITIENIKLTVLTDGLMEDTEAGKRLRLQRLNANVGVGNANIIANGIFTDRNLNAMILNLVNENLPEIVRVGIPATREQWAPILVTHVNNFFANVPIDKFLVQ